MTKKDHKLIAKAINEAIENRHEKDSRQVSVDVVSNLGRALFEDNNNFDFTKFSHACFGIKE